MSRPANARKEDAEAFGASVGSWPAFPDSASALGKLKKLGLRLCILSNVNVDSFAECVLVLSSLCDTQKELGMVG